MKITMFNSANVASKEENYNWKLKLEFLFKIDIVIMLLSDFALKWKVYLKQKHVSNFLGAKQRIVQSL